MKWHRMLIIVLIIFILGLGIFVKPSSSAASQYSIQLISPTDNAFIPIDQDLTVKFKVLNSPETSYQFGYSFLGQSLASYIPTWRYMRGELTFVISKNEIQKAVKQLGPFLHLYIYEYDARGYATGFYAKLDIVVYYAKAWIYELSYWGEPDFINTILAKALRGYIYNVEQSGGWEKEIDYCCNLPRVTAQYDYKASVTLIGIDFPFNPLSVKFTSEIDPPTVFCILKWPFIYFTHY